MRRRGPIVAATLLVAAGLLVSCSAPPSTWVRVDLPRGAWPSSLVVTGDRLLVGGISPDGPRPVLAGIGPDGSTTELRLSPTPGYAEVADLVALAVDGETLHALGVARGGAHGNERWTAWSGGLASPLTDHEQGFHTFGGHEGGPLLGILLTRDQPVVVGSRGGDDGVHTALFTLDGTTWNRLPTTDPALLSNPDRVLSFHAATAADGRILIAGAEVGLAGGVLQSPMLWVGSLTGPWQAVALPVPDELSTASGLAQATSVACGVRNDCWAAGWVRGHPVVWDVDPSSGTAEATLLPGAGGTGTDPAATLGLVGNTPVVFTNADEPVMVRLCDSGWTATPAPAGRITAATESGGGLYVVAGDDRGRSLWRLDVDTRAC